MTGGRWVAPGKVVLVGEYAVLDGAPAIVAAVDSGVACDWTPGAGLRIEAPDDRFVRAALERVGAPDGTWRFSAWRPVDTATKAGLGTSAAATVAAVVAGLEAQGRPAPAEEVHALAHEVHHAIQGSGSGIDVAASAHGGVLRFERGSVTHVAPVDVVVVWSGTSAPTGPRVARYLGWADRSAFVEATRASVEAFARDPAAGLREGCNALDAMAAAAGVDYWTGGLRRIVALAEAHGGAAKPSGAGGGDSAVAVLPSASARRAFESACTAEGLVVLPVSVTRGAHRVDPRDIR